MDKETLSHYGWIVILVLILAVILALASPFGSFIAGAIKSTTAGLFDVNQAALGSAGINVDDLVFENCDHLETEVRNVTDTYTGDTCCKTCGAVLQAGQTVRPKVPDGGTYYVGVTSTKTGDYSGATATYTTGQEFPETVTSGDVYVYGDYEYRYNKFYAKSNTGEYWNSSSTQNGWGVRAKRTSQTSYGTILESINGQPVNRLNYTFLSCSIIDASNINIPKEVTSLYHTFMGCKNLTTVVAIPNNVTQMVNTFYNCDSLTTVILPENVTNISGTFKYCDSLKVAPTIPNSVENMTGTFYECISLTVAPDLSTCTKLTDMGSAFYNCTSLTTAPNLSNCTQLTTMNNTFQGCTALTTAPVIPSSVTNMSASFYGCSSLTVAPAIPSDVTDVTGLFSGCTALSNIEAFEIPTKVTHINGLFRDCSKIVSAPVIPNNVEKMEGTFAGCASLVEAPTIPNSVRTLSEAFKNCTSLRTVPAIPSSVTNLNNTFAGCTSLTTVPSIKTTVRYMNNTFENCTSLTGTITFGPSTLSNYSNTFMGVDFEAQNLTLAGTSSYIDTIGATGTNYCAECNGKCNGGH